VASPIERRDGTSDSRRPMRFMNLVTHCTVVGSRKAFEVPGPIAAQVARPIRIRTGEQGRLRAF
jgi:hypothetical protein